MSPSVSYDPDDQVGTACAHAWHLHPRHLTMPPLDLTNREEPCSRLVVVAAHPDDETLGAGGLIATAAAAALSVYVVLLTAGEASRYASPDATRHALATLRLAEMENALARLAPDNYLAFLGVPDGGVDQVEDQLARSLAELLGDGQQTLLAAPWRHDGHPDHDAAGRTAAVAAAASGARLLEYPLIARGRREPGALPWDRMTRLTLTEERQQQKTAAVNAHASQVRSLAPDEDPPLPARVLAHFATPFEYYVEESPAPE